MATSKWIVSSLFVAVPELGTDETFLKRLVSEQIIPPGLVSVFRAAKASSRPVKPMKGKPLLERIMMVAPELLSGQLVDVLQATRTINTRDAHALRVLFKATSRALPGTLTNETVWTRMAMVFDDVFSPETVSYIRALDNEQIAAARRFLLGGQVGGQRLNPDNAAVIRTLLAQSVARAQVIRSVISTGRAIRGSLRDRGELDGVWDVLTLGFDNVFSEKLLANLVRAGVISPQRQALAGALQRFGAGAWRKATLARTYDGWAARSLLLSEAVLSPETIKVLAALGRLTPAQAELLYPVASAIRGVTRGLGSQWRKSQRYRVVPGERPIRTFARMSTQTDKAILSLLADAARDAGKEAERLAATKAFGNLTRSGQQRLVAGVTHRAMRDVFDNVGSLIIFGEREAATAALEAMSFLQRPYGSSADARDLQRMLRYTAQSGVDAYISREENLRSLSRRVYRNSALLSGQVDREIAKGLVRGLNARELAGQVTRFIHPETPGGASYAAMRLARTEINNAFHQTQIRYTREMPWVEGYKWNLSGSHGRPDVCNDMARRTYPKTDVPGKPHPACLCYVTAETADNATFYRRFRSGAYDRYLDDVTKNGVFTEDTYTPTAAADIARGAAKMALLNAMVSVTRQVGEGLLSR